MRRNEIPKENLSQISERIYSAYQTLRRLPDREQGWLNTNLRSSCPEPVPDWHGYSGEISPKIRLCALSRDISEMEEALDWMTWLGQFDRQVAEIVYDCCALNMPAIQVARRRGCHRNTVRNKRDDGLRSIASVFVMTTPKIPTASSRP